MSENKADLELLLSFINRLDEESKLKLELDSRDSNWQLFFVELNLPKNIEIASEYIFS